jgi:hypothetical protein
MPAEPLEPAVAGIPKILDWDGLQQLAEDAEIGTRS